MVMMTNAQNWLESLSEEDRELLEPLAEVYWCWVYWKEGDNHEH